MVVSSPSGAGKSSLVRRLLESGGDYHVSVSVTTRDCRGSEREGVDYFFVDESRYGDMVREGELLEHAEVFGYKYGTPRGPVEEKLSEGFDVIFDIDWQGYRQLRGELGKDLVSIFLLPPSMKELRSRLEGRRRDDRDVIAKRMSQAAGELDHALEYDWVLVNEDLDYVQSFVEEIMKVERCRSFRDGEVSEKVEALLREGIDSSG